MTDEGWFEIEEEVRQPCNCPGCGSGEPQIVKRRIRLTRNSTELGLSYLRRAMNDTVKRGGR